MKRLLVACLAALLLPTAAHAQDLFDPELRDLFHEVLSGELAKEHVIAITRHHRIQGSRGYRDSAHYVLEQLREYGFGEEDAWIESFPSDGKIHYQTWQSPSGWDITSAGLRMLEPYEERIIGYPEIAMSVITYSNPGDVTAELVWVGAGTSDADYEGEDVKDKLVLATGYGGAVHRLAVLKYGAAAVICYLDDERAADHPDMLAYTGMWPKTEELEDTTFGFNLTNRQGEKLRELLEKGERVVLNARVEGIGLEPYFMDVVVAKIDGGERADEEMLFTAHLDHPKESANDNASGSAAILDIARSLRELIEEERLPTPRRTFRFLWVPEWYGTMAYIDAHPECKGPGMDGKVLANVNLDMVGEDLELLHSSLIITRTPDSVPSVLNDVLAEMALMVDEMDVRTPRGSRSRFNYRITPYAGGSDHMMFLDRDIPAVMFSHSPDYTHHTSEDTPDKVDPVQLERCELIAASAMWYLSELTEGQALDLVRLVAANRSREYGLAERQAHRWRSEHPTDAFLSIVLALANQRASVESVPLYRDSPSIRALVDAQLLTWDDPWTDADNGLTKELQEDLRVPVRATRGPLALDLPESRLAPERAAWYRSSPAPMTAEQRFEIVNFIDGERTVHGIRNHVMAEFGPLPLETVARYLEDLVTVGVLQWNED